MTVLSIVIGVMIMFGLIMGAMMIMAMMFFGSGGMGLGMWGMMIFPFFGLLMMLFIMFFVFRRMAGSGGPMSGMMGHSHAPQSQSKENTLTTLTYSIPAVHCGHCKMRIERAVGELSGVAFVSVDVDTKQAVIKFNSPTTKAKIEVLLAEIGYPPESQ